MATAQPQQSPGGGAGSTTDISGDPVTATSGGTPSLISHLSSASSLEADVSSDNDNDNDAADSAIGSWRSSRSQSLTSSVADFKYENGRRYHAFREGAYHLPNDENEMERLDMQHQIYRIALDGKLYLAPVEKERLGRVLDVGCGTGMWAIDMADEVPNAQVMGFDLSPIQPDLVPPNCQFYVDDVNSEWVFDQKFDLIHTRAMTPGVKDWPQYLQRAKDNLNPGGYIELHEINCPAGCTEATANPKPYFVQWSEYLVAAGKTTGHDFATPTKLHTLLHQAGFVDISVKWMNWPVGPWAKGAKNKQIGRWWAEDMKDVTRNTSALFTRVLGWSQEEFDVFADKIKEEIDWGKRNMWIEMCFAFARKP